ncbi:uncharacterized protein TRIVIDRAFT_194820 [Trichoderma virens Gv29-8]|uniref:SnoaL-like domain-containing protein n=1 Tax=Hypocrea virens (strain Gv29-8 / FGSC 10586) TaxID=413071 RepID=G9N676_HYPVG|nr:uncharacterized protein TRIVIDRAFT_194820 [Trichoderma virens Gv29-8]EHK17638.1 hypothetical protein TRIVIDRAFT_194820 [Trichoderma virens Gv29-8]
MSLEEEQSIREKNKQVVSEYTTEFWGKGNTDVVDKLCSDDFVSDCPLHGRREGKAQVKKMILDFREAFPDFVIHAYGSIPMIAENDYVVVRWIGGGKHTGPAFDDLPIGRLPGQNTGRIIQFSGTTIYTLKDGKIVEEVAEEGALTALQQLGILIQPTP